MKFLFQLLTSFCYPVLIVFIPVSSTLIINVDHSWYL